MKRICQETGAEFTVDRDELEFYRRISPVFGGQAFEIPAPRHCPEARLRRRLIFRNQTHVFFCKSARSGESVFSAYPEPCPYPLYTVDEWWDDKWDELDYGIDFDFNRPFFAQFEELRNRVPHLPRSVSHLENSDYCSNASYLKDCYLVFNSSKVEDCLYCEAVTGSKSCIDCSYTKDSELCYDCTMCIRCYNCRGSLFSTNCRDSLFLMNCINCSDCFGCVNQRNRQFSYFNEQLSEAEYRTRTGSICLDSRLQYDRLRAAALAHWQNNPRPNIEMENCEGCSGNFVYNSKGVKDSFFIRDCEDIRYSFGLDNGSRDCQDITVPGFNAELCYQGMIVGFNCYRCQFTYRVAHNCSNLLYCWLCFYSNDCFGCVGLRRKQYCIFNKQYSKAEYESLAPRIIEKMRRTGEWGEYFPARLSAVPYNLSFAQRYFPRSKDQIISEGLLWAAEHGAESAKALDPALLPDRSAGVTEPLIIKSEVSGSAFKITKEELIRYHRQCLPLPRQTYRERMDQRFAFLGGVSPKTAQSAKTGIDIVSYPASNEISTDWKLWERGEYLSAFS